MVNMSNNTSGFQINTEQRHQQPNIRAEDFCDVSTWYLEQGAAVSGTQAELKHYMQPNLHIQHLQPPYGAADEPVELLTKGVE